MISRMLVISLSTSQLQAPMREPHTCHSSMLMLFSDYKGFVLERDDNKHTRWKRLSCDMTVTLPSSYSSANTLEHGFSLRANKDLNEDCFHTSCCFVGFFLVITSPEQDLTIFNDIF